MSVLDKVAFIAFIAGLAVLSPKKPQRTVHFSRYGEPLCRHCKRRPDNHVALGDPCNHCGKKDWL